jgi:TetR/AcrR family transcriptional regulator, transcriptional repressor for nem operon
MTGTRSFAGLLEGIQEWKAKLQRIVEEGIRRDEISRQIEPRRIANAIVATLEGALMISRLEGNKSAMQDAKATLEIVLDGLAPQGSETARARR